VPDHLSLEAISIDEDGLKMRNGFGVLDLAKNVGEFMLQKGRGIGEAWRIETEYKSANSAIQSYQRQTPTLCNDLHDLVSTNGLEGKQRPESLMQRGVSGGVEQAFGELLQLFRRDL